MVRTKQMAKRDIAIASSSHAEDESQRPHLADEGSEATPLRNELPTMNLLPEVTEELDEFNTARETALSDESGDQQVSDPLLLLCPDEKIDSGDKAKEQGQDQSEAGAEDVVSIGSSAEEISEKRSRKKRVMKKLGLGSSKRCRTSNSGASKSTSKAPSTDELSPPVLAQNTFVSSRVRSKKASERSDAVEDKRVGEIYEQRLAKAKGKAKKGGEGKLSSRSARVSHPLPSSSSAPTPSTTTGPRCFSVHDLGSVSIPRGVLTQDDLHKVLQQTT
ncbi:hypothetical protein HID58_085355 [Brassica napus]|uniref:Uncharacterized protein n=1 Tax=Brassica napus TaxID=3708 RepID=A0ABQ7XMD4_BRANA|nr:hypothetical protein HID58_085355 [Brassica napus]